MRRIFVDAKLSKRDPNAVAATKRGHAPSVVIGTCRVRSGRRQASPEGVAGLLVSGERR